MIREAIATLADRRSLSEEEAAVVMSEIMEGQATPSQLSAFVVALKFKGATTAEIAGLARTMRARAVPLAATGNLLDIVGTGGDRAGTFNISTTAAFVVAAAGLPVAKHGNRAASSRCGSADVLEALGARLDLSPAQVALCLNQVGLTFMFAPSFHPAMKHAGPTRREIGIPTVFNILGPLTNPAGAQAQLLGVADEAMARSLAEVLARLGCRHALVVHGLDGLDELTTTGPSLVCELKDGWVREYTIHPQELGLPQAAPADLKGGSASENAAMLKDVLNGQEGPKRDIVLLNAAAAMVAGDLTPDLKEGLTLAEHALDSGEALIKLEAFIDFSRSLSPCS
jgi:anthranilate phosphoribosyltransferase